MFDDTICWHCGASHTGRSCTEAMQEPVTELEKLTESICGRGVTFYASDKCANCDNYSGYSMPLCDTCEQLPGWQQGKR